MSPTHSAVKIKLHLQGAYHCQPTAKNLIFTLFFAGLILFLVLKKKKKKAWAKYWFWSKSYCSHILLQKNQLILFNFYLLFIVLLKKKKLDKIFPNKEYLHKSQIRMKAYHHFGKLKNTIISLLTHSLSKSSPKQKQTREALINLVQN